MAKKTNLVQIADLNNLIITKIVNELFRAGCRLFYIAKLTGLPLQKIPSYLDAESLKKLNAEKPDDVNLYDDSPYPENKPLIDRILYDFEDNLTSDVLLATEKERFHQYKMLESKCLSVMHSLLDYYHRQPLGDPAIDKFKAQLASEFIKASSSARAELMEKYKVDKLANKDKEEVKEQKKLDVEFI